MVIAVFGINHKTAPVEIREKLTFSKNRIEKKSTKLRELENVDGLIILSTCNRTEFYLTTENPESSRASILNFAAEYSGCKKETLDGHIYWKETREAVHHLFRVAAGLDSMILGENQVLGQVEDAYNYAKEYGISNNVLNPFFQKAIEVGKRVRTDTRIDCQALSVGSAAVEMAKQIFGNLQGRTVLVLGAGETSELTARHLVSNGVSSVLVANRTHDRALQLAREFNGKAIHLDDFPQYLSCADIVISCTAAPHYILAADDLNPFLPERNGQPLLLIDIAVPRDIHPGVACLNNVSLYDVDDLQNTVQKNLEDRRKEAAKAELLVNEELNKFFAWYNCLPIIPVIVALREKAGEIKEQELEKAFSKLGHLTEKDKKIINSLANSIINKFLYDPTANLKEYSQTEKGLVYSESVCKLFNLDKSDLEADREGAV
jgi:glutamyl-tRNA reductase